LKTCSIIVPIYNAASYLAQCLSSIKMQTYSDLQVVLVDDGSTDDSAAIAQSFVDHDSRFSLLQQTNHGQAAARNHGLEIATGEYLVFVDADDYLDCDFIEQHIASVGTSDYVQSGYRRVLTDGSVLEQKWPHHRYQFTSPCMRLYRMAYIQQHRLTFPEGMIYEDVIFSLQLWGNHPHVRTIQYCGYNYTYNPQSTTSKNNPAARKLLYQCVETIQVQWWLRLLTRIRLHLHFMTSHV